MPDEKLTAPPYGLKVYANDDGKAECGTCHEGMDQADVYWLIRIPPGNHWVGLCLDCAKYFSKKLLADIEDELFVIRL